MNSITEHIIDILCELCSVFSNQGAVGTEWGLEVRAEQMPDKGGGHRDRSGTRVGTED